MSLPFEDNPPPKTYTLKARTFERINPVGGEAQAAPDAKAICRTASLRGATSVNHALKSEPNDVHSILRTNQSREAAQGLYDVKAGQRRPSRRLRDYLLLMIGGNGAIALLVVMVGPNILTVMFGLSGMTLLSVSASWIMWVLLRDY